MSRGVRAIAAVTCALCLSALVVVFTLTSFTLVPLAFGWEPKVILTGSMAPSIMPGDVVVSSPVSPGQIFPGRVLVVENPIRPGELLVHRVVAINPDGSIVTRGDANQAADSTPVPVESVRGLPRLRVPVVGMPMVWLHNKQWLPLAGALAGLMFALWGASTVREREEVEEPVGAPDQHAPVAAAT